jgi:hypothetical protein
MYLKARHAGALRVQHATAGVATGDLPCSVPEPGSMLHAQHLPLWRGHNIQ